MGKPAIVKGDLITGSCDIHLIPSAAGDPTKAPPLPFSAPVTMGVVETVLISNRAAAVLGNAGVNAAVHAGLHPADPFMVSPTQIGTILGAHPTVLIGGLPAANNVPPPKMCATPGTINGTAVTVLIGG